jgi:glycosyltransferase involved in cell wall biosynthesis
LSLEKERKIILNISRLYEEKGQKYLIDAMKIMTEKRKDVLCFIGGSGPLKDKLQKQINDSNLQDYVKLIGFVPDELLPIWMNACDVFVLPSLAESFGIVQIEAMACGKPVVATYNGGSEEIITSEDYGFLVGPANPEELTEIVLIALDKEWDGEKILEYAESFVWENITEEILNVYEGVLK